MISFIGRSRYTVVIKTKPDPRGYLIYAVVDSITRFIFDFLIHSNVDGVAELPSETQRKYGVRAGVLYHLASTVGANKRFTRIMNFVLLACSPSLGNKI